MNEIFGLIGTGSMGSALARALRRTLPGEQLLLANRTLAKAEALARELGAQAAHNRTVAARADFIFLGVKPHMMRDLLADLSSVLTERKTPFVLVSMAAGLTMAGIREMAGEAYPVIRIMPNTPCAIGEGVILYTSVDVREEALRVFLKALSGAGLLTPLPEQLFNAGCAVSGCSPAYVDLFLEALADGGVACGLPRSIALTLAAQTMAGTAKLQLATGKHPGELKDMVCSPAGSTIQGVRTLERAGFRSAVMEAVIAAQKRNEELG